MQATTTLNKDGNATRRAIGPIGMAARVAIGTACLALALFWRTPHWLDFAVGLLLMPAMATGLLAWRSRLHPTHLDATGPIGHMANAAVFIPLFLLPATAGAAFVFYGTSMLVAAARRTGGCEVTAIANAALGRDDQVGCVLFAPIDLTEAAARAG